MRAGANSGKFPIRRAILHKILRPSSATTGLRCSVAIRLVTTNDDTDALKVELVANGVTHPIWFDSTTASSIFYAGPAVTPATLARFPTDGWMVVSFDTDFATIQVKYDDRLAFSGPLIRDGGGVDEIDVSLGLYTDNAAQAEALYDDFVCAMF